MALSRVGSVLGIGLMALVMLEPGARAQGEGPRTPHVLILASSDLTLAGEIILRTVREELAREAPAVRVTSYFVDTVARGGELHDRLLADALTERFRQDPVDVVIALGPTIDFVTANGPRVWPEARVVIGTQDGQRPASDLKVAAAVVTPPLDYRSTVEAFLDLVPGTTRVLLMAGVTTYDRQVLAAASRTLAPLADRVNLDVASPVRWADLPRQVGQLPPDTLVMPVTFFQDVDGFKAQAVQFAEYVAAVSNRPVIGTNGTWMGRGIVGGRLVDFGAVGVQLAGAARRLLDPAAVPTPPPDISVWQFDARQLARWRIDERRLPAGSRVLYREPSAWQRYRTPILLVTTGIAIQTLIIAGLLFERRARRRAIVALEEEEARRQRAEAHARVQLHEQSHVRTMAAMGQMAATMAHEMNQPLAAALANAQALRRMLERAGVADPEIDAAMADVIGESKRAGEVVTRIRSLARKGSAEFAPVDLGQLAADAARLVEPDARAAGVHVTVTRPPDGPVAHGDRVQLLQVLLNLLQNAVQAARGHDGAAVQVIVGVDDSTGRSIITVADSGPGIAEGLLPRLFEPFVTTRAEGLGLGLAICRAIVDLHDGEIQARNRSPRGAELTVTLPAKPPA